MKTLYSVLLLSIILIVTSCATNPGSASGNVPKYDVLRKDGVDRVMVRQIRESGADIELEFRRSGQRITREIENLSIRNPTGDMVTNLSGFTGIRNAEFPIEIELQYSYINPLGTSNRNCFVSVYLEDKGDWKITINH